MATSVASTHEFRFEVSEVDAAARVGILSTAHGPIETPAFMAVGTSGTVKAMTADALRAAGCQCILGNTYHLMLRPGADRVESQGGLHRFMHWPGPILTDSGGYQIMSLSGRRIIDVDGVTFKSHLDGSSVRLTPAIAVEIQRKLDSTITMVLDECYAYPATYQDAETSMAMSMRWAGLAQKAFKPRKGYGLFGITQGGVFPDLRVRSADALKHHHFDGYAIGGLAVGEGQVVMLNVLDVTIPHLPTDAPRYLMGVGTPDDILHAVARGIDMFDCVIPTRSGRTARAYTSAGVINLRNARFAEDPGALDDECQCPACRDYSRAYLHHLFRAREILGPMLLTWHNIQYYQELMRQSRAAIKAHQFLRYAESTRARWGGRR